MAEVCEPMFKSLSEILFRPRASTPMGETAANTTVADPAFAEAFREIEDISVDALPCAAFLLTTMRELLPIGAASLPAEGADTDRGVAEASDDGLPKLAARPMEILLLSAESQAASLPVKAAPLVLEMASCTSTRLPSPDAPPENEAKEPVVPKLAASETRDTESRGAAPFDLLAPRFPPPNAKDLPEQTVKPEVNLVPRAPLSLRQKSAELVEHPQVVTPPIAEDSSNHLSTKAASLAAAPAMPIALPPQAGTDTGDREDKSVATISLPVAPGLAAIVAAAPTKAMPLRPDDGALQFTWRQTIQAETLLPDHTHQPAPAQPASTQQSPDTPQPPPIPSTGLASNFGPIKAESIAKTEPVAPDEGITVKNVEPAPPLTPPVATLPFAGGGADGDQPLAVPEIILAKPEEEQTPPGVVFGMVQAEAPRHAQPIEIATARHIPPSPVHQVVETLATQPLDTPGRIELTLTPDNLGKLHFDMRPEAGGLSIVLSAERPDTLDLMRRHLPDLMAELKQVGIQTGSFSFSSWNGGQRPPSSLQDINNGPSTAGSATALSSVALRLPQHSGTAGGLDMRF